MEEAGGNASKNKFETLVKKKTKSLGNELDENGINPDKLDIPTLGIKPPTSTDEWKTFPGAMDYIAKVPPKL